MMKIEWKVFSKSIEKKKKTHKNKEKQLQKEMCECVIKLVKLSLILYI